MSNTLLSVGGSAGRVERSRSTYLGRSHPLAGVAGAHCRAHAGTAAATYLGGVACGRCWELAIRDDERAAVEHNLPREQADDPTHVDVVAVERACAGERLPLNRAELLTAVRTLEQRGLSFWQIAARLHKSSLQIRTVLDLLSAMPAPVAGRAA